MWCFLFGWCVESNQFHVKKHFRAHFVRHISRIAGYRPWLVRIIKFNIVFFFLIIWMVTPRSFFQHFLYALFYFLLVYFCCYRSLFRLYIKIMILHAALSLYVVPFFVCLCVCAATLFTHYFPSDVDV